MYVESFIFETPPMEHYVSLKMSAKRYRKPSQVYNDGVTLLMFHGLGQHKEQWEPVLESLYALQLQGATRYRIREAWSFDWQSHGESAVLNEDSLGETSRALTLTVWGAGVGTFLKSGHVSGHHLVGIGYSSGTVGLTLSTKFFPQGRHPYAGIILIEPSMIDQETWKRKGEEIQTVFDMYTNAVTSRRDSWASKEAALGYFLKRFPWNTWDPRIVELFVEHGLRMVKDKNGKECVVRKCPVVQEATAFQVNLKVSRGAVEQLTKVSRLIPVHVVFGETVDLLPSYCRECVVDSSKGRRVSSITKIPDVGHMIVQERPDIVASTISVLLDNIMSSRSVARL